MTNQLPDIAERLAGIQERMLRACARCGRDPAGVRLVAVSKTVEPERIRQALACGVTLLGENYIQEAREKIPIIDNQRNFMALYRPSADK